MIFIAPMKGDDQPIYLGVVKTNIGKNILWAKFWVSNKIVAQKAKANPIDGLGGEFEVRRMRIKMANVVLVQIVNCLGKAVATIIKNMIVRQVQSKPIFGKIRQKSIVAAKSKGASFAFGAIGDDGTLQIGQIKVV